MPWGESGCGRSSVFSVSLLSVAADGDVSSADGSLDIADKAIVAVLVGVVVFVVVVLVRVTSSLLAFREHRLCGIGGGPK